MFHMQASLKGWQSFGEKRGFTAQAIPGGGVVTRRRRKDLSIRKSNGRRMQVAAK